MKDAPRSKDFFTVVAERSSVRSYLPDPLGEDTWDALFKAAMAAPSAVNCQPWDFIRVTDPAVLKELAENLPFAKMCAESPAAVLVCASPGRAFNGSREFAVVDATLAAGNLLLAATALGLGAVWTAVYPEIDREQNVRRILGVPWDVIPLALIPLGKPRDKPEPKPKYKAELIHRNSW